MKTILFALFFAVPCFAQSHNNFYIDDYYANQAKAKRQADAIEMERSNREYLAEKQTKQMFRLQEEQNALLARQLQQQEDLSFRQRVRDDEQRRYEQKMMKSYDE
jgi:hypothetical protein